MNRRQSIIVSLFALVSVGLPVVSFAAGGLTTIVPESCNGQGGCQSICDIAQLAQNVLNDGIYIAVFLSAGMFAWAGFEAVSSGGNPEKYTHAKTIFGNVLVGLIIILVGWLVVDTVMKTMVGQNSSLGPWNAVCTAR